MKYVEREGIEYEALSVADFIVKDLLFNPLMNYVFPARLLVQIMKGSGSQFAQELLSKPGSWKTMKLAYENRASSGLVDKLVLTYGTFAMGLRNRKRLVVATLKGLIDKLAPQGPVIIVGIGAGGGVNTIEAMAQSDKADLAAFFLDIDKEAFEDGKALAREHGVLDNVHYIEGDAKEIIKHITMTPQIIKFVGILEYFPDNELMDILRTAYSLLSPGGYMVTNTLSPIHGTERVIKRVLKLNLIYRSPEKVIEMMKEVGFTGFQKKVEPLNIYHVIVAEKSG